jgi:hypothetical protein
VATSKLYFHPVIATAIAINAVMLAAAVALSGSDPAPLSRLLIEDRLAEWMQFLCFAATSALLGYITIDRASRSSWMRLDVLGLAGLTLLVAVAACEEISWFQRVLTVETPEYFRQNNRQGETNLHNLALGGASLHKTVLLKLIALAGLMHNLVLPLLARWRPGIQRFVESLGLYLPPLSAAIVYLVLVILSHVVIDHPRKGELGEMFGAVHYLATVFTAYVIGLGYGGPKIIEGKADGRRISTLFAMFLVFLVFVAWLLGSTSAVLAATGT